MPQSAPRSILTIMIYVFGIIGFVLGFAAGLFAVHHYLRGKTRQELIHDKSLRWTYGLAVWASGGIGAALGVWLFTRTFT